MATTTGDVEYCEVTARVRNRLLGEHDVNERSIWIILGEDPNCDFGGHHLQPELGVVEGKYRDVVDYAIHLHNFISWGAGGNIKKLPKPKAITAESVQERSQLVAEKIRLEKRLAEIESKLA